MAEIRESIMDALKTAIESITTANLYLTDIKTVEFKARNWLEMNKTATNVVDGGWVGIASQNEAYRDNPNTVDSIWTIAVIVHQKVDDKTGATSVAVISNIATDMKNLIYDTQSGSLGVAGVHSVSIVARRDSIGSPEALQEQFATSEFTLVVKFEESTSRAGALPPV